ncbi:MAG TPA: peptidylprolyl isomerase, partial [Motiliproteus sp.]
QEGEVSGPVQTEFGFHLIKTLKVEHSAAPSFEQAQAGLRDELRQQRAEAAFVSKVEELADVSFSAADLVEPAQVMGLEIQSLPSFGREGDDSLLGSHPRVLEAAFSDDVLERGHNSAVIELSAQQAVVVRLREHLPSRQLELAEVRDQITAELERAKAAQQLKEKAEAIAAAERQGESQSVGWMIEEAVARSDQSLGAELVQELFRMPKPAEGAITVATLELADGSAAVLALTQVQEGDAAKLADNEATMIKAFLASRTGQYSYRAAIANRLQAAEVERL